MVNWKSIMGIAAALPALTGAALADPTTGNITGTVQTMSNNAAGPRVPLASVSITGSSGSGQFSTKSDSSGHFEAANLPEGDYIVTVPGFASGSFTFHAFIMPNVHVVTGKTTHLAIALNAVTPQAGRKPAKPAPAIAAPKKDAKPTTKAHLTIDGQAQEIDDLHKQVADLTRQLDAIRADLHGAEDSAASPGGD